VVTPGQITERALPVGSLKPKAARELRAAEREMTPVASTNLDAVGWLHDPRLDVERAPGQGVLRCGWLLVRFRGGSLYAYAEVPDCLHETLAGAASKGEALSQLLIGHYQAVRLR
jgi:hypothetical protein